MEHNPPVNENELLRLLQDFIRIESVNPNLVTGGAGELEIASYIEERLKEIGLEVQTQEVEENRTNVIGLLKGTGEGKSIMLNGHIDTVSIDGMNIEPLNPKVEHGKVYGRGALDMKSSLAAMIMAAKSVVESGMKLKGDVLLTFVVDEEYRSSGTEKLIEAYFADAAVVCEPTNLGVGIAHKGFVWARIEILGKRAHGSLPDEGVDAITKAGKVLVEIEKLDTEHLRYKHHPLLGPPSVHASIIRGGIELSTYPDWCEVQLERRILPEEDYSTFEHEIGDIIERIESEDGDFKARSNVFFWRPALEVSPDQVIVQSLYKAATRVLRKEPVLCGVNWWLDSALFAEAGIPVAIFGPSGKGLHASVEYVDFDSVIATTNVFIHTIVDLCGT